MSLSVGEINKKLAFFRTFPNYAPHADDLLSQPAAKYSTRIESKLREQSSLSRSPL